MSRTAKTLLAAFSAALLLGLDLVTKHLAETLLRGKGVVNVVGDLAVLVYAENEGAFLGLGASFNPIVWYALFVVLPVGFIGFLVWLLVAGKAKDSLSYWAYLLFIVGGAGNVVDRLARNRLVRDFMNFGIGTLRTGVLNVADLYVTVAAVLLVIWYVREERARKAEGPQKSA